VGVSLKPKSRGGRRSFSAMSEINVTPMVDVMLVLLIIFMVSAPLLTVGVPVNLPQTEASALKDPIEPLVITVDSTGKIYVQESETPLEELVPRLTAISQNNPTMDIYIRGDHSLSYGQIMQVMGHLTSAGFKKVSLIAEKPKSGAKSKKGKK